VKTSESVANIAPALIAAQIAIQHVVKDKTGKIETAKASYQYKYSDLGSVIEAVKPHLNANGIAFVQCPTGQAGSVGVTTTLLHTSGEWISETTYMPVAQSTPQAYGSAITYAKRYGLQSMTGLPSEDDDGKKGGEEPARPNTATQVAHDALASQAPEEQAWLREQAMEIMGRHQKKQELADRIDAQHYDNEQKLALWSLLPSDVRTAIKKQQAARQMPALSTQA
jgi:hypothetical protein